MINAKLRNFAAKLGAGYWFTPTVMSLAGAGAAIGITRFDHHMRGDSWWHGWIQVDTPSAALEILSTIAGSTISLAALVFSITILTLSFASSQHGPRLLRNFMRDRASQCVLGSFVSTYVYCLLILRSVGGEPATIPHAGIAGALVLGVASVAVLIYFIHHIARAIQVSSIIHAVGRDLEALICEFAISASLPSVETPHPDFKAWAVEQVVRNEREGYIQALANRQLVAAARELDAVIELEVSPGDYVNQGRPLATVRTRRPVEDAQKRVSGVFVLGRQRTNEQDLEFPIDQLAEIGVRAMSSALNDPFTAIICINRLGGGIARLASLRWPESVLRDEEGMVRVILRPLSMHRLLRRAFSQILHYGGNNPAIPRQVMKVLGDAAETAVGNHLDVLRDFADIVHTIAKRHDPTLAANDFQDHHRRMQQRDPRDQA